MRLLPKISIVIPSYNKVEYIKETLDSILFQKYPNLEIIIQDGGSSDGSLEIIKNYTDKYPKLFRWESGRDNGQVDAINKGLNRATGEILTYINSDDVYKKGALLAVGKYFFDNPNTLWLAGQGGVIDRSGKEVARLITRYKNCLLAINKYPVLLIVNYLMQPSIFLSKMGYKKYGPFKGSKTSVMEYDLWLKLGKITMPVVLKKYLSSFRLASGSISSTKFSETLQLDEKIASEHTSNKFILLLHRIHNLGRKVTLGLTI